MAPVPDVPSPSDDAFGNVTDIRVGRHDGFDRVVFEFGGTGAPGWDVRYVDRPASQGSGAAIELEGEGTRPWARPPGAGPVPARAKGLPTRAETDAPLPDPSGPGPDRCTPPTLLT